MYDDASFTSVCCREVDPVEDTERTSQYDPLCMRLESCREVDPVEDTESACRA